MKNIKTYKSWITRKKHDDIVENIIDYVTKNNIVAEYIGYGNYRFYLYNRVDADPFGEESPKNKLKVDVGKRVSSNLLTDYYYSTYLDDDELESSSNLSKKLFNILKNNENIKKRK